MNTEQLKAQALAKYESQGRYEIIYANYFSDFLKQYDDLVSQGYTKPDDRSIESTNINLAACQVLYMIKPAKVQETELQAIYKAIEDSRK